MAQSFGRRPTRVVQSHADQPQGFNGLWDGVVVDVRDPERLGRVKVRIFDIHDENTPVDDLPWSDPCFPTAFTSLTDETHNGGLFHVPPVDSLVYVMFRHGDPDFPVWMGGFHPKSEAIRGRESYLDHQRRPALYNADGVPTCPTWGTAGGHRVELDDEAEEIRITTLGGMKLTLSDQGGNEHSEGIKLEDNEGNYVWLDTAKKRLSIRWDGDVHEHCTGDRHTTVEGSWYRTVKGDLHTDVTGQEMHSVGANMNMDTGGNIMLNCGTSQPQEAFGADQGTPTQPNKGILERLNNQIRKILTGE